MPQIVATRKTWYQIRLQNDFVMKLHILMPSKRLRFNFAVHRFYVLGSLLTIQGRKVLIFRRLWPRKLFKGGKYSRAETIRGNTVYPKVQAKVGN